MPWMRNIHLLRWFNFFLDFRPYGPIAVIYFSQVTDSFALGLAVFSVTAIASSFFEIPTGVLSDRMGRKKTLVMGAIASIAAIVFYALGGSFVVLAVGAILEGLAIAFFSGNNDALLYDTLASEGQQEKFAEFSGKASSMFQLGLGVSAFIGGFIADISFSIVMWVSVIPQVMGLVVALLMKEPRKHYEAVATNVFSHLREALIQFKKNPRLRALTVGKIVEHGIGETMHQFTPAFFALLLPTWALGLVRSIAHAAAGTSFWFAGRIIKRFSALKTLLVCNASSAFVSIFSVLFPTPASPILMSLNSLSFGASFTSQNSLLHKEFTDAQRATMGSIASFFGSIFFAIFAFFFGFLADQIGPTKSLLTGMILELPLLLLYWNLFRKDKAMLK